MLHIENITLQYGGRILAEGIDFTLAPGECILLAGANGTGKTTLLHLLAGWGRGNPRFPATLPLPAKTLLVPTGVPKVEGFTVEAFVRTSCYRESNWAGRLSKDGEERITEALELLGIRKLSGRDISTLSDGEFQKACIAVGLVRQADVLLLDEPTAFLEVENRITVLQTLHDLARKTGITILFSSHDLSDALLAADRVFVLTHDGRFLVSGTDDASKRDVLRCAFGKISYL